MRGGGKAVPVSGSGLPSGEKARGKNLKVMMANSKAKKSVTSCKAMQDRL